MRRLALVPLALLAFAQSAAAETKPVRFSGAEKRLILLHGPWPPKWTPDPSNRFSGNPAAIRLGRTLFFSPALSRGRDRSCATCHRPDRAFQDGTVRPRSVAAAGARVDRNTLSVANQRLNRWFGWAGQSDTLWAQSVRPLLDPRELAMTAVALQRRVAATPALAAVYARVTGTKAADHAPPAVAVTVGKLLAAWQETLVTGRTAFDRFRDALAKDDRAGIAAYPEAAKRGLRLFVGRGKCSACHFGPNFTNGEFHNIGVLHFVDDGKTGAARQVDKGRYGGIQILRKSVHNLLGAFNDDPARRTAGFTRRVRLHPRNWGEFRVPSLRNVARTAPYMHAGSHKTLTDVVRHYSEIPENRLHQGRARLLRPLNLSKREIVDLVAFLRTLTAPVRSTAR